MSAASSPQAAENVLSRIPEGACGAAVLKRLFQTDAKIQGLVNQVRIEGASPLSSLKGWLGVQQGLDEQGSALLVLMPVGDRKTPPAAIVFLPVTDYQQFLRALSPHDVLDDSGQPAVDRGGRWAVDDGLDADGGWEGRQLVHERMGATWNVLVCLTSRLGGLASFTDKPYSNFGESDQSPTGIRRAWGWAGLPSVAS